MIMITRRGITKKSEVGNNNAKAMREIAMSLLFTLWLMFLHE